MRAGDDNGLVAANLLVAGQRHVEVLVPAIDELCRQAATSVADLDAVAVDIGPGLFTGLRAGLATATTIAYRRASFRAVGVTSLEALATPTVAGGGCWQLSLTQGEARFFDPSSTRLCRKSSAADITASECRWDRVTTR